MKSVGGMMTNGRSRSARHWRKRGQKRWVLGHSHHAWWRLLRDSLLFGWTKKPGAVIWIYWDEAKR